jgi:hypothetical protein
LRSAANHKFTGGFPARIRGVGAIARVRILCFLASREIDPCGLTVALGSRPADFGSRRLANLNRTTGKG